MAGLVEVELRTHAGGGRRAGRDEDPAGQVGARALDFGPELLDSGVGFLGRDLDLLLSSWRNVAGQGRVIKNDGNGSGREATGLGHIANSDHGGFHFEWLPDMGALGW